jgi:hypothetical protein
VGALSLVAGVLILALPKLERQNSRP